MKEILSFSIGSNSNHELSYFWQIQEAYLDKSNHFHESFYMFYTDRYLPRCVYMDHGLCIPSEIPSDAELMWDGPVQDQLVSQEENKLLETAWKENLLCLYERNNSEEIEDKVRWLAERSERTQGFHLLMDWTKTVESAQLIEILEDCYPKLPSLLFTDEPTFRYPEAEFLYNLKDFSHLLHVPSGVYNAQVSVGIEVLSYVYRSFSPLTIFETIKPLLRLPCGNTAMMYLQDPPEADISIQFERGSSLERFYYPESFPMSICFPVDLTLQVSEEVVRFNQQFAQDELHCSDRDRVREINEYLINNN